MEIWDQVRKFLDGAPAPENSFLTTVAYTLHLFWNIVVEVKLCYPIITKNDLSNISNDSQ